MIDVENLKKKSDSETIRTDLKWNLCLVTMEII